jgi:hypothetical protein
VAGVVFDVAIIPADIGYFDIPVGFDRFRLYLKHTPDAV